MQGKEGHTEWGTGDLLSLLIAAKNQDGTPAFSPVEVHDEVRLPERPSHSVDGCAYLLDPAQLCARYL